MARVLFCTYGSGGDLFPLIPIARRLEATGDDVLFAVSPALGLYLRSVRLRTFTVGDGTELGFGLDDRLVTPRLGGWASFQRIFTGYVAPTLRTDVDQATTCIERWNPDVVVTTTYAPAGRIAALRHGIAHVSCTIYPQHFELDGADGRGFAGAYLRAIASVAPDVVDAHGFPLVAWGTSTRSLVLHERALLDGMGATGPAPVVGLPYWDDLPSRGDDRQRAAAWLRGRTGPVVAVTLGSFLGTARTDVLATVARAASLAGAPTIVVNAPERLRGERSAVSAAFGYVPLAALLPQVDVLVHHGGLSTTMAAVGNGCASVVVPQAFDQGFNGALVHRAGAGSVTTADPAAVTAQVRCALEQPVRRRVEELAARLTPTDDTIAAIIGEIRRGTFERDEGDATRRALDTTWDA